MTSNQKKKSSCISNHIVILDFRFFFEIFIQWICNEFIWIYQKHGGMVCMVATYCLFVILCGCYFTIGFSLSCFFILFFDLFHFGCYNLFSQICFFIVMSKLFDTPLSLGFVAFSLAFSIVSFSRFVCFWHLALPIGIAFHWEFHVSWIIPFPFSYGSLHNCLLLQLLSLHPSIHILM